MLFAFVYSVVRLFLDVLDVRLRVRNPEAELLLLRHQLRVVRRQLKRPQLDIADRTILAALSRRVNSAALVGMLVQPETVLGWHRALVRWVLVLNQRHLERVLAEWLEYYNRTRPHRALLRTPIARSDPILMSGSVTCRERLGGLLREYSRAPAATAA